MGAFATAVTMDVGTDMNNEKAAKNLYDLHRKPAWPAFYNMPGNGRDYWRALALTADWPGLDEMEQPVYNRHFSKALPKFKPNRAGRSPNPHKPK